MSLLKQFSERARKAFQRANNEARRFNHRTLEAEHILLGLFKDDEGVAVRVLKSLHIDQDAICAEVERLMHTGVGTRIADAVPHGASAERVIEYAIEEAQILNHNYLGTEHILLGLLRESEGVVGRVLNNSGLRLGDVRSEVKRIFQETADKTAGTFAGTSPTDAEKAFFLAVYRRAVDFYQPKIEKRTGVSLGTISVWDYAELHCHVIRNLKRRLGLIKSVIYSRRINTYSRSIATTYADNSRGCSASYYRNGIYVSFSSGTAHDYAVAELTVHELSHALWEKIEGVPLCESWGGLNGLSRTEYEKFTTLVEGYSTYAEGIWFRDFYPPSMRKHLSYERLDHNSIHYRGLEKILNIVKQSGQKALLEIPRRWRSL